jgi:two-component system sensor histidine kinase BaeS
MSDRPPQWQWSQRNPHRWGRPAGRPPWWPEGGQWPPGNGEQWRRHGRRTVRRVGCVFVFALLVFGAAGTALVWLVLTAVGAIGSAPFVRLVSGIGLLLGLCAITLAVVVLRRATARAAGLVDAAGKIEAGDYSARVPVRGPRELRSLARAFNAMSSRLEAEEARRQSILADVAHELRTPLTIIRGQAEGIVDGVYPADPNRVAPILAATHTLEMLVEDLRTLGLAEIGSLRLQKEPVDLGILVDEALGALRATAADGGVTLIADVAAGAPPVDADPARLRSVLSNLLTNALRYTPRGGTVRVKVVPDQNGFVRVSVQDDGQGIPPELLARVFDRFVKGRSSTGSGLGLAIVRDIVEAHGGSAAAHSEAGRGTTIDITLPVVAATH